MIYLDSTKVTNNVLPKLNSSISLINESYKISCNLKKISPNLSSEFNKISTELNFINNRLKNSRNHLIGRMETVNKIEKRKDNLQYKISSKVGLLSTTTFTSDIKKTLKIIKNKYTDFSKTGAKIGKKIINFFKDKFFISHQTKIQQTCAVFFKKVTSFLKEEDLFKNTVNLSDEYKNKELNRVIQLAKNDTQINTSGKFDNFTDFQNIMMSDFSLIELLFEGDEQSLKGKTIGELYKESLLSCDNESLSYEDLSFDGDKMLEMSNKNNWEKYRSLVLGKMVRYGFSDIKINKKIRGQDGFDAFVLEDTSGNVMVYFPCTNLIEVEDFIYDAYPLMDNILNNTKIVGNVVGAKKVFNSQQSQSKQLLDDCIKNYSNKKINVSGFSLGGSLAECAYLNSYKNNPGTLNEIVLFNPYHNRLSNEDINILKDTKKLKLYVCEGDSVSTIFNYEELSNSAKKVYIDYKNNISNAENNIEKNNSLLNKVVNEIKLNYCNKINNIIKKIVATNPYNYLINIPLTATFSNLDKISNTDIDAVNLIKNFTKIIHNIIPIFKKFGYNVEELYNLEFLENLHYIEIIFTSTHLTYTVDNYKEISFDANGNIKSEINISDEEYNIKYPSFKKVSSELMGSDIYTEVYNISRDLNL